MPIKPEIRDRLLAEMTARNLSWEKTSREAKLGSTYLRDVFQRGRGKLDNLITVAETIGKSRSWLLGEENAAALPAQLADPQPNASARVEAPGYGSLIEVIGVSRGGADGKLIFNGEVIERIPRPPELEGVDGAYASYVIGDSMYPRFREGDRVWVHPRRPARKGIDVVVQVLSNDLGDPPEGYIKEFVSFSGKELVLKQHNPPDEIRFPREQVKTVHVIVGVLFA